MNLTDILDIAVKPADFLLPDHCAVCDCSLVLKRHSDYQKIPLCTDCMITAENDIFSRQNPSIRRCRLCGYPLTSESEFCLRCRNREWNFNSSTSLFLYSGIAKTMISAYKFGNRKKLAVFFARLIDVYFRENCDEHIIVPVPYRPSARRKRGWDQIDVICRILGKEYGLNVLKCLARMNGRAQKTMSYSERLSNLKNRISLIENKTVPRSVLLIDDVFTTGATMNSCAEILRKNGACDIRCLSLALDL